MATVENTEGTAPAASDDGLRRRDFLNVAAVSTAAVGGVALLYPLVNQMNPSADVLALAQIDVDISATPFTNTLPIRRLGLQPGEFAELDVAFVDAPAMRFGSRAGSSAR